MLAREIKKILTSPLAWISVLLLVVFQIAGVHSELLYHRGNWIYLVIITEGAGAVIWAEAVLCPLAAACSYYDERKANYEALALTRAGRNKYHLVKILAVMISSMLVFQIAMIIFLVTATFISGFRYTAVHTDTSVLFYTCWIPFIEQYPSWIVILIFVVIYSMTGGIYALISLCSSVFCRNRYVVIAAPLMIGQMITFLGEMFDIPSPLLCRHLLMINQESGSWWNALADSLFFNLVYILIFSIVYICEMKWRAVNG